MQSSNFGFVLRHLRDSFGKSGVFLRVTIIDFSAMVDFFRLFFLVFLVNFGLKNSMFGFLCSVFHHAEAFTKVNRKLSRKRRTMLNQVDANEKNKRMRAVTVM